MEIQNNVSNISNITVSKPSRDNASSDGKTGLERVTEAIEQGKQMREAISGDDKEGSAGGASSAGGQAVTSDLAESLEKIIKALEKQIKALMNQLSKTDDMEQKQALQSQINSLQSQVMKMQTQLLELGGDVLSMEA